MYSAPFPVTGVKYTWHAIPTANIPSQVNLASACGTFSAVWESLFNNKSAAVVALNMTDGLSASTDLTLGVQYAIVVVAECRYGCSPVVAGQFAATHPTYITVGKPAPANKKGDSGLSPGATAGVVIVSFVNPVMWPPVVFPSRQPV